MELSVKVFLEEFTSQIIKKQVFISVYFRKKSRFKSHIKLKFEDLSKKKALSK
jgi:hypothetical protein